MNYNEALDYIYQAYAKGSKHGLVWVNKILERLGDPQRELKVIHVAGTNGKGSVCAMLDSVLRTCGYSVGMFTSPHLITYNERIRVNGQLIPDEEFAFQIAKVRDATIQLSGNPNETLSFFEILTIAAFNYFHEKKVDFAIIETGLGGRLDSTNVVEKPILTIITAISYDHTEILGNTLEEIACEKAGIIKENCPLVLYSSVDKVYNAIVRILQQKHGRLYYFHNDNIYRIHEADLDGTCFSLEWDSYRYDRVTIALIGEHQVRNACHALLAVEALRSEGVKLPDAGVLHGMAEARWSGRMEIICSQPLVVLDGAHNAGGAEAFSKSLDNYFEGKKMIVVAGVLLGKDYHNIINMVASKAAALIVTQPESKKALAADVLRGCISGTHTKTIVEPDYRRAVDLAISMAGDDLGVAVTGSIYLAGDVKKYLINKGVSQ